MGQILSVTESFRNWVTERAPNDENQNISYFIENMGLYAQHNVQHDNADIHNCPRRHSKMHSNYPNSHGLTLSSRRKMWISVAKTNLPRFINYAGQMYLHTL